MRIVRVVLVGAVVGFVGACWLPLTARVTCEIAGVTLGVEGGALVVFFGAIGGFVAGIAAARSEWEER